MKFLIRLLSALPCYSLLAPVTPSAPYSRTPIAYVLPLHDRPKVTVNCLTVCLMTYSNAI